MPGSRRNATRGFDGRGGVERLALPRVLGGGGVGLVSWLGLVTPPAHPHPTM